MTKARQRRQIPPSPEIQPAFLRQDRIKFIRELATVAASQPEHYPEIARRASSELSRAERGYFIAWRDAVVIFQALQASA